ncbi:putative anion transporter 4, chloroplastic [Tetrabaena socialis]|uniref:Putative anion transporter 4, chloroplastic n=1 Tax=Tetrabaena socialis TaxID=47790 RepID=A0A2J7ZXR0_9CHLO|nr:putative anion transporter 4, chloroplastic [Tetrabaena socialis]|eukprot:PNH05045.1 putative anion transporter 4, chloroplastic [Tetrabaena socialis]
MGGRTRALATEGRGARGPHVRPAPPLASAATPAAPLAGGPAPAAAPSTFLTVLVPTALALLLCNMDRICLSVAIMPMAQEFGWPASLQGVIQSAFLWGYMATQLAGGSLADRHGGKLVLAGGIAWFSVASLLLPAALTPATVAAGLTVPAVLLSRFLVGLGEGVALPAMSNLVATYVPPGAKARALGFCFTGFHSGNLAGLILSPLLLMTYGWRGLFYTFGALGLPLLFMWLKVVPASPTIAQPAAPPFAASLTAAATDVAPSTDEAQAAAGAEPAPEPGPSSASAGGVRRSVTASQLLTSSATWAIIVVNVVNHFGYFIYLNWMPTYFNKALGFDLRSSSFTAFLPWLVMAAGSSASGFLADTLVARGVPVVTVRKALQSVAFLVPAVALLVLAQPGITPAVAVGAMTVALGTTSLGQAGFVANMSDIAPAHAGKMFGLCNTFGCLSGIVGVTAVGFIVEATKSFAPVFQLTSALYVAATVVWNLYCTADKVFD